MLLGLPECLLVVTSGGYTSGFKSDGAGETDLQFVSLGLGQRCFHTQLYSDDPPTMSSLPEPLPTESEFGSLPPAPGRSLSPTVDRYFCEPSRGAPRYPDPDCKRRIASPSSLKPRSLSSIDEERSNARLPSAS